MAAALAGRVVGAVRRRMRRAWSRLTRWGRRPSAEAALLWLVGAEIDTGGLSETPGAPTASPALTAAAIETALELACREEARRWARWLASIQRADGSIPDPTTGAASFENTIDGVRAFRAIAHDVPEVEEPVDRACRYLGWSIDADGRLRMPSEHPARTGAPVAGSLGECTRLAAQYLEEDRPSEAAAMMKEVSAAQRMNGSVRELFDRGPVYSASLARAAVVWYRLGCRAQADRAVRFLERRQNRNGGFRRGWGTLFGRAMRQEDAWAAKLFLDAVVLRVRAAFDDAAALPDRIDPSDGRMRAVKRWFETLPGDCVADVGCGQGRFLRHLRSWFPQAPLTGIDVSPAMLAALPEGVTPCRGSLLRIPAPDATFDGVFAVESLEHALVPERALAELCRVVRPGGRVLVIDKHESKQALSECEPWERWFLPDELAAWLARHCDDVAVEPISHGEGRAGDRLFLAATGTRRA